MPDNVSTQPNPQSAGPTNDLASGVVESLMAIVEAYRKDEITKVAALLQLQDTIPLEPNNPAFSLSLANYVEFLDEHDRARAIGEQRGNAGGQSGQGPIAQQGSAARQGDHDSDRESSTSKRPTKRRRVSKPDSDSEEEPTEQVDTSTNAWEIQESLAPTSMSAEARQTLEQHRQWYRNHRVHLQSLRGAPQRPAFPDSEWENIIRGRPVNLDVVLSNLNAHVPDARQTERVGSIEIKTNALVASKKVTNSGEWITAWTATQRAYAFTMPWRKTELEDYSEYISRLFTATPTWGHGNVIIYDRACRTRVSQRNTLTFSDYHAFSDLHTAYITAPLLTRLQVKLTEVQLAGGNHVTSGTTVPAEMTPALANTRISVESAGVDTKPEKTSVRKRRAIDWELQRAKRPRYARDWLWENHEVSETPSSTASETAPPIPSVPRCIREDSILNRTLQDYPHLFKIITPVNVDRLEQLLTSHPNRPLVESVCRGFREGFWPFARYDPDAYPVTHDASDRVLKEDAHRAFVREQRDEEIRQQRYSSLFGSELKPGMYSMPIGVVPKPHSDKFRLVIDHSAGNFSLNSMIAKDDATIQLDNIKHLGKNLLAARRLFPDEPLLLFKSDVSQAYRNLPVSPYWQLKQIVTIDGNRYVDRCNVFGNRAAGRLWCTFMSLVLWIANNVRNIPDILVYVDDSFGWERAVNLLLYGPYNKYYPTRQTRLLMLWDELGVPHEERKQVYGTSLPIIGFEVNINDMSVSMTPESKELLAKTLRNFVDVTANNRQRPLRDWQKIGGSANWGLNAFPRLRPGLDSLYRKIAGKDQPLKPLWVNEDVIRDLRWMSDHFDRSNGIMFFRATAWEPDEADVHIFTDASMSGIGFWTPTFNIGFKFPIPFPAPNNAIFFYETLAVLYAIHWASTSNCDNTRLAIHTDNFNTVHIFNSLSGGAEPAYTRMLQFSMDYLIGCNIDLRVYHISGVDNKIADALSRDNLQLAFALRPSLTLGSLTLPAFWQGALRK